jgi:flagellar motor switch protein FliM
VPVDVRAVGACQSATATFLESLKSPGIICQIRHASSAAESLLVWDADLVQLWMAQLLGGIDVDSAATDRPMTPIERRVFDRLNDPIVRELAELLGDSLKMGAVHAAGQVAGPASRFPCIWFSFEIVGPRGHSGLIHLGIPSVSLGPGGTESEAGIAPDEIPPGIRRVAVQLAATLTRLKLKASDLASLQVGDIVMTDVASSGAASLQVDGKLLCPALMGTHLGRKALRLTADPAAD